MDGLDEMIRSMSSETSSSSELKHVKQHVKHDTNTTLLPPTASSISPRNPSGPSRYTEESEAHISAVVQAYHSVLNDLADQKINEKINKKLSDIKFSKFVEYFLENASLSQYSIETELSRMDFEVTYQSLATASKSEIQDIFWETKLHDVWRFANQSIYADLLKHLQIYFADSNLNISAVATKSMFVLNLDKDEFSAIGSFDIVVESHNREGHRLCIATVNGNIDISLRKKTVLQLLHQPVMKMVFDSDLRDAAITLLASEDNSLEMSSGLDAPPKIDAIVDAVSDTANALPQRINTMMTDMSLEGAVGFFGKLVGAGDRNNNANHNDTFGDLSTTLRANKQLPVHSKLSSKHLSSHSTSNDSDKNDPNDDDWEDWD